MKEAITITHASTNTAAALIDDLVTYGVLVEMTRQRRNRLFVFKEYVDLFRQPQ